MAALDEAAGRMAWFCCSDGNHWPLAERLVAQLDAEASPFAVSCRRVDEDMTK